MYIAEFMVEKTHTLFKCTKNVNFPSYQGYGYHCTTKDECYIKALHIILHLSTTVAPK